MAVCQEPGLLAALEAGVLLDAEERFHLSLATQNTPSNFSVEHEKAMCNNRKIIFHMRFNVELGVPPKNPCFTADIFFGRPIRGSLIFGG